MSEVNIVASEVMNVTTETCTNCDYIRLFRTRSIGILRLATRTTTNDDASSRGREVQLIADVSKATTDCSDVFTSLESMAITSDFWVHVAPNVMTYLNTILVK